MITLDNYVSLFLLEKMGSSDAPSPSPPHSLTPKFSLRKVDLSESMFQYLDLA